MTRGIFFAFCFAVAISAAHCRFLQSVSENIIHYQLDNGEIITEDLSLPVAVPQDLDTNDVSFYLYTNETGPDNPCEVTSDSCTSWTDCGFDPNKETVVVSHGYAGKYTGNNPQVIKNAYLNKKDLNVILIDWSKVSFPYLLAVASIKDVGTTVGGVLSFLQNSCGADPNKAHCVGHSLGSHVCGNACATLPLKCARCFGLDPAAPIVELYSSDDRLDITDCVNLQNIHTSDQGLSETSAFGDIDFYPNAANRQYGCPFIDILGACDHNKACPLYADTILHPNAFTTDLACPSADAALESSANPVM